jgi:hypothetical protein
VWNFNKVLSAKALPCSPGIFFVSSRHVETVVLLSNKNAGGYINVNMDYDDDSRELPSMDLM